MNRTQRDDDGGDASEKKKKKTKEGRQTLCARKRATLKHYHIESAVLEKVLL